MRVVCIFDSRDNAVYMTKIRYDIVYKYRVKFYIKYSLSFSSTKRCRQTHNNIEDTLTQLELPIYLFKTGTLGKRIAANLCYRLWQD